jgi:isopenicillin N synthase-like dioxygenase
MTKSVEDTNGLVSAIQSLNTCITHTSILTLLDYRKGARHQGKHKNTLISAQTDVGVITVLLFDGGGENSCAMLQRKDGTAPSSSSQVNETNNWVNVTLPHSVPRDPVFVVNIGDCL